MNETHVGRGQGYPSYGHGNIGNLVHDGNGSREPLTVDDVYRNDRDTGTVSPTRSKEWTYKVRATAISIGLFSSGFAYFIVELVKR